MKSYSSPRAVRFFNRIISVLLRLGAPMGPMALLTVPGRVTGKARSTPVAVNADGTGWRLTAAYGVVDWVKNLRAAGEAILTARGRRVRVRAAEIPPREAAPHLRRIWADAGATTRSMLATYYDTAVDAPIEAWEQEAARHPMFRLEPAHQPAAANARVLRLLITLLVLGVGVQVFLAGLAAFGEPSAWAWHGSSAVVVEAISLTAAIVAIATRRVGTRWLTTGIFLLLIMIQHGTATIGSGIAAGLHPLNALIMLTMALVVRRRLRAGAHEPVDQIARDSSSVVVREA